MLKKSLGEGIQLLMEMNQLSIYEKGKELETRIMIQGKHFENFDYESFAWHKKLLNSNFQAAREKILSLFRS